MKLSIGVLCTLLTLGAYKDVADASMPLPPITLEERIALVDRPIPKKPNNEPNTNYNLDYQARRVCTHLVPAIYPKSSGKPHQGTLQNGIPLTTSPCLDVQSTQNYGSWELINAITETSFEMYREYGVRTEAHDLSKKGGGFLPPHKSHQNGRDADISLFYFDPKLNIYATQFGPIGHNNNVQTWEANWFFLKTIQDQTHPITMIFLDQAYINKLHAHVLSHHTKQEWDQYGRILQHAQGHTTHFHIRIEPTAEPMAQVYVRQASSPF